MLAWVGACVALYVWRDVVLSMSYVAAASFVGFLAVNLRFYLQERGQKALIRDAFGQYLSPKVVNILVKDPTKLSLGGERREMTAFFSDIAGFSTISEHLTPEQLVALLNEYLTGMCDIIARYDGTVDKFEGDAIIAFWGAPLPQPDHARLACLAAIDMQRHMVDYRQRLVAEGRPLLNIRIGMNTGPMLVGNLGSRQRMDYTIMGDAVNLASRLEGVNKEYGTRSMISENTYAHVRDLVEVRELDRIRVIGRREPVTIYELLERKGELRDSQSEIAGLWRQALDLYRGRDFTAALRLFEDVLKLDATDGPSRTYVQRCREYLLAPPAADWDGVYQMHSK
jgi:adenylate cyclase